MKAADARAEEAADLVPAGRHGGAGERQSHAHVQIPEGPPYAARETELEHAENAPRAHDPRELSHRRDGVADIPQEIRDGERVELVVGEGKGFRSSLAELDAVA